MERFEPSSRQVFFGFTGSQVRKGDEVLIEWIDPQGMVAQSTPYSGLPAAQKLCFLTQLPVAGFEAASKPGAWQIEVTVNGQLAHTRDFQIAPDPNGGRLHVSVVERAVRPNGVELTLSGAGFEATSVIHVAQYTAAGGWKYIYRLEPGRSQPNLMTAAAPGAIPVGDYIVIVRNADGSMSQPARLEIASDTGYKLPLAAGEPWTITQGPYGGFSHFGKTSQAWDIAPIQGKYVVAMRGGVAHTFDGGWKQTQHIRSFGNYITIEHGDGEYSHYAHLATGTFRVANGQRVEQGQALAVVGNSGYTFGAGGGYHLHVQVTREFNITSPSIPFRFEDLPNPAGSVSRPVVSKNSLGPTPAAVSGGQSHKLSGVVQVEQWWSQVLQVAARSGPLDVTLTWQPEERDLDLHLISPTGKHYGPYYLTDGYTAAVSGVEKIRIAQPETGYWRVSVRGIAGPPGDIPFEVESSAALAKLAAR